MTIITLIDYLPCSTHCSRHLICIKFNLYSSLMKFVLLSLFCLWGTERVRNISKALQLVSGTVVPWTQTWGLTLEPLVWLTTVLYVSQREKRLRVSVLVHFYSLCRASTRDWLFLNSWVSHLGAARWVLILKIIWTYCLFSIISQTE